MKLFFLFLLAINYSAHSALDESKSYVEAYISYVDEIKTKADTIEEQKTQVKNSETDLKQLEQVIKSLNSQIAKLESELTSIPTKITQTENAITKNENEFNQILYTYFPNASSAENAKSFVTSKLNLLKSEKSDVQSQYREKEYYYDGQIRTYENELLRLENRKSTLNSSLVDIEEKISGLEDEAYKLRSTLAEIKFLQNNPDALNRKIADARRNVNKKQADLNEKKQILGKENCKGFLDAFKTRCRRYFNAKYALDTAKSELQDLIDIKNNKGTNELSQKLKRLQREISQNKSYEDDFKFELRSIEQDISYKQDQISRLNFDKSAALRPYLSKITEIELEINSQNKLFEKAERLSYLQRQNQKLSTTIKNLNDSQNTLPDTILNKKSELLNSQAELPNKKVKLEGDLATLNKLESSLADFKNQVIMSENALIAALDLNQPITLGTSNYSGVSETIYNYKMWSLVESLEDATWGIQTCKALTSLSDKELKINLDLEVSKLKLEDGSFSEPLILITISKSDSEDVNNENLDLFYSANASASSKKDFDFLFAPYLSNQNRRVFIAKLDDRKALLDELIRKNYLKTEFRSQDDESVFSFSLAGSSNTIKGSQQSLSNQCGGIDIY